RAQSGRTGRRRLWRHQAARPRLVRQRRDAPRAHRTGRVVRLARVRRPPPRPTPPTRGPLMLAVVIAEAAAIFLLGLLVAGLLRSHAEILRALHDLGAAADPDAPRPAGAQAASSRSSGATGQLAHD